MVVLGGGGEFLYEQGTPVGWQPRTRPRRSFRLREREFFIDNLLVRIHLIMSQMCFWWTGLAPWEFEFPFPGSLISTFLVPFLFLLSAPLEVDNSFKVDGDEP